MLEAIMPNASELLSIFIDVVFDSNTNSLLKEWIEGCKTIMQVKRIKNAVGNNTRKHSFLFITIALSEYLCSTVYQIFAMNLSQWYSTISFIKALL